MTHLIKKGSLWLSLIIMSLLSGCYNTNEANSSWKMDYDKYLERRIKYLLFVENHLFPSNIQVFVTHQIAQISGDVASEAMQSKAIALSEQVPGIKNVISKLQIKQFSITPVLSQ